MDLTVTFEDDGRAWSLDGYFAVVDAFEDLFGHKFDLVDDTLVVNPQPPPRDRRDAAPHLSRPSRGIR